MSELNVSGVAGVGAAYGLAQRDGCGDGPGHAGGNGKRGLAPVPGAPGAIPDPEVQARPQRRRFPAAYKARIVEEAEACTEPGAVGGLLRREGLYSSHLSTWREQYRAGALDALRDDKRGRKAKKHPLEDEVTRLRKENARLSGRLERAEAIIEIQKKGAAMLGNPLTSVEPGAGD
jgi:transposase-like protein